jgi:hypothetical protein
MNKEIAGMLKNKISDLPFIDQLAGLVQTVEIEIFADQADNQTAKVVVARKRFPVSYDVIRGDTNVRGLEKNLAPDSSKKSITYFEDYGSQLIGHSAGYSDYESKLRVVCWLNRKRLVGETYSEITAVCVNSLVSKLCAKPFNYGLFSRVIVKVLAIPAQDKGIFGRYTYDEVVNQYLRPPYEFFAMDLSVKYRIADSCINEIDFTIEKTC